MIESGASSPISSRPVRIRSRYDDISGRTYALTTVVAVRSYSRCSRRISLESEIVDLGQLLGEDPAERARARGTGRSAGSRRRPSRCRARAAAPQAAHVGLVERQHDRPVRGHALRHLEPQAALDERLRLAPEEVVHVRHAQAAKLEDVAEVLRREERGRRRGAAARRSSRPWCRARPRPAPRSRRPARRRHRRRPCRRSVASREACARGAPVRLVEDHVREGSPDVDTDRALTAHLRFAIANCVRPSIEQAVRRWKPRWASSRPSRSASRSSTSSRARSASSSSPEAARGDAARAPRARPAARRLADAGADLAQPARARGVRRGHPDRARARPQADARGLRGDLRGAARARGPRGEGRRRRGGREDIRA